MPNSIQNQKRIPVLPPSSVWMRCISASVRHWLGFLVISLVATFPLSFLHRHSFASYPQHLPLVLRLDRTSVPVWHLHTSLSPSLLQFCSACCQWVPRRRWRRSLGTMLPYHATISSRRPALLTSSGCCRNPTPNREWWDKIPFSLCFIPTFSVSYGLSKRALKGIPGNAKFTVSWLG